MSADVDEKKKTIVFIHGKDSSSHSFLSLMQCENLKKNFNLVAVDVPGSGDDVLTIDEARRVYASKQSFCDALNERILKKLGSSTAKFGIVGHSMGARAAVLYTTKFADRVEDIVIEDMHFHKSRHAHLLTVDDDETFSQWQPTLQHVEAALQVHGLSPDWVQRKIGEGMIRQLSVAGTPRRPTVGDAATSSTVSQNSSTTEDDKNAYFIGTNPLVTRLACKLLLYDTDDSTLAEYARVFSGRTLFAMASKSPACDENGLKLMLGILPTLQVARVPNSAHSIHGSQRDAFAKLLCDFFSPK